MTEETVEICPACSVPLRSEGLTCPSCGAPTPTRPVRLPPDDEARSSAEERAFRSNLDDALGAGYQLGELVGRGGFGAVYLARDLKLGRKVAVKALRPDLFPTNELRARFEREARVVARLRHPNILPVYTVGEGEGIEFMVMPLVEGESLRAALDREGQLPVEEAVRIAREVSAALDAAHAAGVVHRDVKPENILLEGPERHALLMDFGLARGGSADSDRLTAVGTALGTPLYMSPEQAAGEVRIDARSDVYSLACVLYEMLAGDPPFTGSNVKAIMARHLSDRAPSLAPARPEVPVRMRSVIEEALRKIPADRPASAAAFSRRLAAALTTSDGGSEARDDGSKRAGSRSSRRVNVPAWLVPSLAALSALALALTAFQLGRSGAEPQVVLIVMDGSGRIESRDAVRPAAAGALVRSGERVVPLAGAAVTLLDRAGRRVVASERVVAEPGPDEPARRFETVLAALPDLGRREGGAEERMRAGGTETSGTSLRACFPRGGSTVTERPALAWSLDVAGEAGGGSEAAGFVARVADPEGRRWTWRATGAGTRLPDSLPELESGVTYSWDVALVSGLDTLARTRPRRFRVWSDEARTELARRLEDIRRAGFDPESDGRLLVMAAYQDMGLDAGHLRGEVFGEEEACA